MSIRVILAELVVARADTGAETTLYFSDMPMRPFRSDDADRPDQAYDPRLIDPANVARELSLDLARFEGTVAGGSMVLSNADGALNYLRGYVPGRLSLYWGAAGDAFSTFVPLLVGRAGPPDFRLSASSPGRLAIPVYDLRAELDSPLQGTTYAGTNNGAGSGYEGTEDDLKGLPKPLALGDLTRANIPGRAANVQDLVDQLHDGKIEGVTAIYNGGGDAGLTLNGTSTGVAFDDVALTATEYEDDRARGLVKRGGVLANIVTYDLKGAADTVFGDGYDDTAGPLIKRVLAMKGITGTAIGASFGTLNATQKMGLWLDTEVTALEAVDALAASIGGFALPDRTGTWQVAVVRAPAGNPVLTLLDDDIIDIAPDQAESGVPVGEVSVLYARNYTVMRRADMQASVHGTDREAYVSREWRRATAVSATTKARWPDSYSVDLLTGLVSAAEAQALADDVLALLGPRADGTPREAFLIQCEMTPARLALELGSEVHVTDARAGIDADMILMAVRPTSPQRHLMTLRVYG
ncbi:hypothetical protein [Pyruvatibacter sp.]|uniref:hypothetical protein n=1 Tax=Pyruvatibacter sp. TaxID=1981328 RepID=UPI0032EBDA23